MKIDEAIEQLGYIKQQGERQQIGATIDAAQLGIEALERIKSFRTNMGSQKFWQLPGETLD